MNAAKYRKAIAGGAASAFMAATWAAATWLPVLHGTVRTAAQAILAVAAVPAVAAWVARAPRNDYGTLNVRDLSTALGSTSTTTKGTQVYRSRPDVPTQHDQ